jgi:nucleotide-binding universal stress UspA family protein
MSNPLHRILVAVDMSSCSRAALVLALKLAKVHSARIEVLHATSDDASALRSEVERFVSAALAGDEPLPSIHLLPGAPREAILNLADQLVCDVIVLGTHGRTGRARMLAGSVAESVVRAAKCPVVTVREAD